LDILKRFSKSSKPDYGQFMRFDSNNFLDDLKPPKLFKAPSLDQIKEMIRQYISYKKG
jgi:hypothetical protein